MCRVLFFYFFMGIKVAFLIPPPHTFVLLMMRQIKQSATNQATNKLNQCVSYKTNEASYICAANWTDLTICNKLSNITNHVMCNI